MSQTVSGNLQGRHKEVSKLLISQPKPANSNSPYFKLAEKYGIDVDFKQFIQIDGVSFSEFRKEKINFLDYTAVIFTSRNAVDHYFRICVEANVEMPADMKYFCVSEQTANYLQKYITIRKRKMFTGLKTAKDLIEVIRKQPNEKYLFPCSDIRKGEIPHFMLENNIIYKEVILYKTVSSDLSELDINRYDMIAFFSPSGVSSLKTNFPGFQQGDVRIAAFGPTTAKAVRDNDLVLDIEAPMPNAPSMTGAIELYIKEINND
jgi:uroporphyrinogen-III synthase